MIGQVQSRQCIEDVIRFAKEEHLFLMADEVMNSDSEVLHSQFPLVTGEVLFSVRQYYDISHYMLMN